MHGHQVYLFERAGMGGRAGEGINDSHLLIKMGRWYVDSRGSLQWFHRVARSICTPMHIPAECIRAQASAGGKEEWVRSHTISYHLHKQHKLCNLHDVTPGACSRQVGGGGSGNSKGWELVRAPKDFFSQDPTPEPPFAFNRWSVAQGYGLDFLSQIWVTLAKRMKKSTVLLRDCEGDRA